MVAIRTKRALTAFSAAVGVVAALALAACAEESGVSSSGGGAGVPAGASKEEYRKAFEDVSPITLRTQTPAPKGSVTGLPMEKYFEAVTDWSGGKITFEIAYSNAIAPPAEADNALVDGRLDIASVLPIYEPSEFPANAALIDTGFISDQSVVAGTLQSNAWPNDVAFATEAIVKEFHDHGMVPLIPVYNSGVNALFCNSPRSDLASLRGMTAASGGTAQSAQIRALGGAASSVPYTEIYESLQRGAVDCTVSSLTVAVLGGYIPAAPHVVIDPDAGFSLAPGAIVVSKTTWESLPLVARQLLWDRIDVFLDANVAEKIWPNTADAVKQIHNAGGKVTVFAPDARSALQQENERLLTELRSSAKGLDGNKLVDDARAAANKWLTTVKELGYSEDVAYDDFDTWFTPGKVDLTNYTKKVIDEIFAAHRPS